MKPQHFLLTGIAVALLSACGSDNRRTVPDTKIEPVEATVEKVGRVLFHDIDIQPVSATVYYDLNGDMEPNEGEPVSPVAEDGSYKLTVKESDVGKGTLVAALDSGIFFTSAKDSGIISGLTSMLEHLHSRNKDTSVEQTTTLMKTIFGLTEEPDVDFVSLLASPTTTAQRKLTLAHSENLDAVIRTVLKKFTKTSIEFADGYSRKEVHNTILYYMATAYGLQLIEKATKLHAAHKGHAVMDFDSWPKDMQTLLPIEPSNMTKLIPLAKAMMAGVDGNPAKYFATDGFANIGFGDPEGEEHAPMYNIIRYDSESEETHLANYYLQYNDGNGYFRTSSEIYSLDHFVLDTTNLTWHDVEYNWDVKSIDLDTGKLVLENPDHTFMSLNVASKVADASDKSIDMFLSRRPDFKKSWGHLVDTDAVFKEGSEIHTLHLFNNNQLFVLPKANECNWDATDVKYAQVDDKKLCNHLMKRQDGETSQALSFEDFFVNEFASSENSDYGNVDGIIAAMDGSSYIIAQIRRAEADDKSGDVKFFKDTYVQNEEGEYERSISVFPTSIATTWTIQTIGSGDDAIDLFRITIPKEVTSFGREMRMAHTAFAVELGEGENRALRHGRVIEAGQMTTPTPQGLNSEALESLLESIDIDKFDTHEHEEFFAETLCHDGNSLMKDTRNKLAYAHSMRTRDEYHLAAKRCLTHEQEAFVITDVSEKILTLSKYDEDPFRKIRFEAATGNTGDAKVFKDVGGSVLYKYDATYVFDDDTDSVKVSFTDPVNGNKHHIYLSLLKRVKDDAGKVKKQHFKTLHITGDSTKGIVAHQIFKIEDLTES